MANSHELLVSASDAESLALVVGKRSHSDLEAEAADALAEVLFEAQLVPHERLPLDRIAMNSRVTYVEEPAGKQRTVSVVHPRDANAGEGRISVLSPIGRALLGRRAGAVVAAGHPGARALTVRILSSERGSS